MIRADMISTVGRAYLISNIENDEYSYPKAYTAASLTFVPIQNSAGNRRGGTPAAVEIMFSFFPKQKFPDPEGLRNFILLSFAYPTTIPPSESVEAKCRCPSLRSSEKSSMPLDSIPRSMRGLRFATTITCLPTHSSGLKCCATPDTI